MAGRPGAFRDGRYQGITYLTGTEANGFVPDTPDTPVDLVYLCFPNNPTGVVATHDQLARYVAYARDTGAVLLYDAAYVEFIRDETLPHSIYEIDGAETCAIEFRSYSKTAGFTGMRCALTVVPRALERPDSSGAMRSLRDMWLRRQSTKFNGASYPIQRAAAAIYTDQGRREVRELSDYYLENARLIRDAFIALGYATTGGVHAPYVWIATGGSSWDLFDLLLQRAGVVTTPGSGFGPAGEGYIRVSAFNDRDKVETAIERIVDAIG
jgi:LL-diaminopimelate aminotransferase